MPFSWDDSYLTGISKIDQHHHHLFALLNKAYADFIGKSPTQDIVTLIDELIDYTSYHFAAEEQWMEESGFPDFKTHKKEHDRFSKQVLEIYKESPKNEQDLLLETLSLVHGWLSLHIAQVDAEFGRFMATKNMRHE